jgi:GTPase SAR1 family protein
MFNIQKANYELKPVEFKCDNKLAPHIMPPFCNKSFFLIISGRPGSGKTSLLISMLSAKGKNRIYRNVFTKITLVMPKSSIESLRDNIFEDLPNEQQFDNLKPEIFQMIQDNKKSFSESKKPNQNQLLILDDVASQLRDYEDQLKELCQNRRHLNLSIILLTQTMRDIPRPMRLLATDVIAFKANNNIDNEIIREEYLNTNIKKFRSIIQFIYRDKHDYMYINKEEELVYKNLNLIENLNI